LRNKEEIMVKATSQNNNNKRRTLKIIITQKAEFYNGSIIKSHFLSKTEVQK